MQTEILIIIVGVIKIFQAWEGCASPPYVGTSAREPISARD